MEARDYWDVQADRWLELYASGHPAHIDVHDMSVGHVMVFVSFGGDELEHSVFTRAELGWPDLGMPEDKSHLVHHVAREVMELRCPTTTSRTAY